MAYRVHSPALAAVLLILVSKTKITSKALNYLERYLQYVSNEDVKCLLMLLVQLQTILVDFIIDG